MDAAEYGIAVIGIAGRFPGAENLENFWQNLCEGVESISSPSNDDLLSAGIPPATVNDPSYMKAGGRLGDIAGFDAPFFGYSPREAELIDPQQRVFLECAWEALENAGYATGAYDGPIGVYAGSSMSSYLLSNLLGNPAVQGRVDPLQIRLGNDKDFLSTRVSYKLGLTGPSIAVQTACSTSLVAVHYACQSLLYGECDMALAGGVSISVPQQAGYLYREGSILSPDGHCRAFDAGARGTIPGNGAGIVVLRRLADALANGDCVRAVIRGSAINNDGAIKVGYTAPSIAGQAKAIEEALAMANVEPDTITYVEAHGTGTRLGDPIEIAALTQAFRTRTMGCGFCAIGSVKTNIGHLDAAAGVAGLIKTVLALEHKQIPPSLHFECANPEINFATSPFFVNTALRDWDPARVPRRAGVSSFGMGGTNAHVVLEEAPVTGSSRSDSAPQLLVLSAGTESALEAATTNLAEHLGAQDATILADVAYTLQVGRAAFRHRRAVVARDAREAVNALMTRDPERSFTSAVFNSERSVVMMFPGQGSQYTNMARDLYDQEAVFRAQIDYCAELLKPHLGLDIRDVLYPDGEQYDEMARSLDQTWLTQPALFVTEYALARWWMEQGVEPEAMIGHSIGEYVAACLAGVFSLEDALRLVAARGRLMQQQPAGAMLGVPVSERELQPLLSATLSLAAVNGPELCTVAGPEEDIADFQRVLTSRGIISHRLKTSHAFHSSMMDPVLVSFRDIVSQIHLSPPTIHYVSNVTGTQITAADATDPDYWCRQLRQTVRFAAGVTELLRDESQILLETGPGRTLSTLARRSTGTDAGRVILPSLRHPADPAVTPDTIFLLHTLGMLWLSGARVKWVRSRIEHPRKRIPLPPYPFEHRQYWVQPSSVATMDPTTPQSATIEDYTGNLDDRDEMLVEHPRPRMSVPYHAPETALEGRIAKIWQEILGLAEVGSEDDFFELGGDSLIATQVLSRFREMLPIELSMHDLFGSRTVAALARVIERSLVARLEALPEDVAQRLLASEQSRY